MDAGAAFGLRAHLAADTEVVAAAGDDEQLDLGIALGDDAAFLMPW